MSATGELHVIRKTVKLHRTQRDFCRSSVTYRGFVGGRGSGKSFCGAYDLIRRAKRGRTYNVASPTSVLMQDTTFPTTKAIAQDLGVWGSVKLTPYPTVELTTGATIRFRTAEDPEKLRGPNLSGVWFDEASLMDEDAYKIAIASLREAGEQGWLSATFTPKGLTHWTYDVFGKDPPRPNTALFHCETRDNPFLPPAFAATLAEQYVGQFAAQELGGLFVQMEGAEWPASYFPPSIWFDDWPRDLLFRVMALDPSKGKSDKTGDYSAFVMLGMCSDKTLWVDADLARRPTPKIVEDGLDIYQQFQPCQAFAIETNMFQELLGGEFARVARERALWSLPLYGLLNTVKKEVRIRTLGPLFAQRRVRFRNTPGARLLVQQLRDFPVGEFDDGPDAAEMSVRMLMFLLGGRRVGPGQPEVLRV